MYKQQLIIITNKKIFKKVTTRTKQEMIFQKKNGKMSELRLEDMPDEILMKVLSNLDIYGNMDCQVFKKENQIDSWPKLRRKLLYFNTVNKHT